MGAASSAPPEQTPSPPAAAVAAARFHRPARPEDVTRWQRLTAPWRRLPDFLILGTQRGGTTSLYEWLSRHPGVVPAREKEVHYFDFQMARGPGWYRAHFPARGRHPRRLTGEASPFYLFHPRVPGRVRRLVPAARLIVLLRDPVARAHSHYRLQRRAGVEPLATFEAAVAAEPGRLRGEAARVRAEDGYYSHHFHHHSYLARGLYHEQLERWFEHFPREQFLILRSEELHAAPARFFGRVRAFLDLPPTPPDAAHVHLNHQPGEGLNPETRARLREYFAGPNAALYARLGEDFNWG